MKIKGFEHKCICDWSKDNKFGFVPYKECPAHGKQVKNILKNTINKITKDEVKKC